MIVENKNPNKHKLKLVKPISNKRNKSKEENSQDKQKQNKQ